MLDIRSITCYNTITEDKKGREHIKYSELERELKKAGCYILKEGSNHSIWFSPVSGQKFTVPRHKTQDVPKGTLKSIRTAAGLQ
nr:MAG TPA: toxin [Caudoviricetes sp.]